MFNEWQPNVQIGVVVFAGMTAVLLMVLRFTRHSPAIRQKIKAPLFTTFLLLTVSDILYITNIRLPAIIQPYFFALLYLAIAILVIRLFILFFFDVFLVRNKKYRAPQLLKEITTVVLL